MGYGVKTYYGVRELANAILLPLYEHRHDYVNVIVHAYRADGSRARGGGEF